MPQAKLPDINHAWVFYRAMGVNAVNMRNYPAMVDSIQCSNALLPDDYRVEVNTEKYNQLMKDNTDAVCTDCKTEINYTDIKIVKLLLNPLDRLILKNEFEESWSCSKCLTINRLEDTRIIKSQLSRPFYNKVIPFPPSRKEGIGDRTTYHNLIVEWYYLAKEEIDHQLGKYRDEYRPVDDQGDDVVEGDESAD